jgi:hypothetical protein
LPITPGILTNGMGPPLFEKAGCHADGARNAGGSIPIVRKTFHYVVTLSATKMLVHAKAIFHRKGFFVVSLLRMTG